LALNPKNQRDERDGAKSDGDGVGSGGYKRLSVTISDHKEGIEKSRQGGIVPTTVIQYTHYHVRKTGYLDQQKAKLLHKSAIGKPDGAFKGRTGKTGEKDRESTTRAGKLNNRNRFTEDAPVQTGGLRGQGVNIAAVN